MAQVASKCNNTANSRNIYYFNWKSELNILDGVTSTMTEINVIDGDTSATSATLADADRVVTNDNGTMKQVALTDVKTYLSSAGFSTEDPTALAIALGFRISLTNKHK